MRIVELRIDEDGLGVEKISLVADPAIEVDFLAFNKVKAITIAKNNFSVSHINEDEQIITGPALIPNKFIFRYDEKAKEGYYVYFTKATVKRIAQQFLKEAKVGAVNVEHTTDVEGINLCEAWYVSDPACDKAKSFGFNVSKDTWMVSLKFDNSELWQSLIKTGAVKGFSIEGLFCSALAQTTDK
jgi:hypothetical protein